MVTLTLFFKQTRKGQLVGGLSNECQKMDSSFSDMTVLNRFKIPNVISFQTLCCTTIQHQLVGS